MCHHKNGDNMDGFKVENGIWIYYKNEKKHLVDIIFDLSSLLINAGTNEDNKYNMFEIINNFFDSKKLAEEERAYTLHKIIKFITLSKYDIVSTHPFKLKKFV